MGTMWVKIQKAGKVPHLSRWFDCVTELPGCKSAISDFDLNAKRAAAKAIDAASTESAKKGGGGEQKGNSRVV